MSVSLPGSADATVDWLFAADAPWVVYNTRRALLDEPGESPAVRAAYAQMQAHPAVAELFEALSPWPPAKPLGRAYDPKDSLWTLSTLADFGLVRDDSRVAALAEQVFAAQAPDGGFLHGGFDHTHSWDTRPYICIAHVMTGALGRFGYADDPRLGAPTSRRPTRPGRAATRASRVAALASDPHPGPARPDGRRDTRAHRVDPRALAAADSRRVFRAAAAPRFRASVSR